MTIDELNALIQEQYRSRVSCMHYDESKREIIEKRRWFPTFLTRKKKRKS